ncbi:MAG: hypothetical protein JWR69_4531 [Pedosphaera sp.]|nr:hypothetical protein [Pedosphaera sp.]
MKDDDFEFINGLFCKLVDKQEDQGAEVLTKEENVVLLIWHASGIIGNGGFRYFFEQELNGEAAAAAYTIIGCDKAAELLRLGLSLFPNTVPPASWEERVKYMDENAELFDRLSEAFWEADQGMQERLAEYTRSHFDKKSGNR